MTQPFRAFALLLFAALLPSLAAAPARAVEWEQRAQFWHFAAVQGRVDQKVLYYLEAQPRLDLVNPRITALLLRPAIGFAPIPQVSFWLGVAWIPSFTDLSPGSIQQGEDRFFQQVLISDRFGPLGLMSRTRLEQRLLPGQTDLSHRVRTLGRASFGLLEDGSLSVVGWDEVFALLNGIEGVQQPGFDQNRAFGGLSWRATPTLTVEAGYLNVVTRLNPDAFAMTHALYTFTIWSFF